MIRYDLRCAEGHGFDSWFASSETFDRMARAGHVTCPDCGSIHVEKAVMSPSLAQAPDQPLRAPRDAREAVLADLRRRIEENSDYVGLSFAAEARAMHEGLTPERPIHGEARLDEAKKLIEDGVPVAPLPFLPTRKAN